MSDANHRKVRTAIAACFGQRNTVAGPGRQTASMNVGSIQPMVRPYPRQATTMPVYRSLTPGM